MIPTVADRTDDLKRLDVEDITLPKKDTPTLDEIVEEGIDDDPGPAAPFVAGAKTIPLVRLRYSSD